MIVLDVYLRHMIVIKYEIVWLMQKNIFWSMYTLLHRPIDGVMDIFFARSRMSEAKLCGILHLWHFLITTISIHVGGTHVIIFLALFIYGMRRSLYKTKKTTVYLKCGCDHYFSLWLSLSFLKHEIYHSLGLSRLRYFSISVQVLCYNLITTKISATILIND